MVTSQIINRIDELKPLLGNHFIIMFGSAVSGVMEPRLPMIFDLMDGFLEQAAKRLHKGSYWEKVISGYATNMVDGYHRVLKWQTKFENFIFDLQSAVGKEAVDELFVRIFSCTGDQYNNNHSALAFLLKKRICLAALTTNFDNQIELCLPGVKTYIYPKRPKHLPSTKKLPILVKLHGDAPSRTYVATSPQLSQARTIDTYAFLEELLRDQVVLVLGYSGTGDIDIAPHLGKKEKILVWGDLRVDPKRITQPNQVDLLCDLSLSRPGLEKNGNKNILLELAASYGWKPTKRKSPGDTIQWEDEIVNWTQQIPLIHLSKFIMSFMSWRTSWPHVHMAYLSLLENNSYENRLEYALSIVQVAAYNSSERVLKSLLLLEPPDMMQYLSVLELLGFTYWGKRRYQNALSLYMGILKMYELISNEWDAKPPDEIRKHVCGMAREYLEVLLEVVNNERNNQTRRKIVRESQAESVVDVLKGMEFESNYYLNQIAIMETRYWLGNAISQREVSEFFGECMAMQEWEAAALTAQFMFTISFEDGRRVAKLILPQLKNRKSSKLIIKVNARMWYERTHRFIPIQILNFKAFTGILLVGVDIIFTLKRILWSVDRRLKRVRVETGFLGLGVVVPEKKK